MNTKKKDINLLVAAGVKKGVDFKASLSLIMIIVLIVAIGAMGIVYISSLSSRNKYNSKIATYENTISSTTTALKLAQLEQKNGFNEEILTATTTGKAILDFLNNSKSIYVNLSSKDVEKIKVFSSGVLATYVAHSYTDNRIEITFEVTDGNISEIPNISSNCIKAITDMYKGDVFKPLLDNKLTLKESDAEGAQGKTFVLVGKMQNFYELIKSFSGITINDFVFTSVQVTFKATTGAPKGNQTSMKAASDKVVDYGLALKNDNAPLYFASVKSGTTAPTVVEALNPQGIEYVYYSLTFTCTL